MNFAIQIINYQNYKVTFESIDSIIATKYKNLHSWDTAPFRLFNLKNDPQEKLDISSVHPEKVKSLRKKIEAWHSVD